MFGARLVACLLLGVAMVARVCHSQSCLDTQNGRTYNRVLVSERAVGCMDQGTGVDLVASSKCECAQATEEADLNTFRYSEDGCTAFQAVPVAGEESGGRSESETVEVYVAAEPTGDTALPPDVGTTATGLSLNLVGAAELVAQWDGVGDYSCRAVGGYRVQFSGFRVEFSNPSDVVVTPDLSATVSGPFDPDCGDGSDYSVTVTAQDEEGNDFGTPARASADLSSVYNLECCSPPFVMADAGCVYFAGCSRNFTEARAVCQAYGTDFFTSSSVEETLIFSDVVKQLSTVGNWMWIGMQKAGDDYAWLGSERPVDAAEWQVNGRNDCPRSGDRDCGLMMAGLSGPVCNYPCSDTYTFFCSAPTLSACESTFRVL